MGDDHDAAGECLDPVTQPDDRVVIKVVRGFVEEQHVGVRKQHARELDTATLAARQRVESLVQDTVFEAERVGNLGGLGVGRPSTGVGELLVELDVAFHRALLTSALGRGHLVFSLADPRDDGVDPTYRNDAITCLHLWVTNVRILREVANSTVGGDCPRIFGCPTAISFASEKTHRRRLTSTITADETDAHAFIDAEARMVDELTGANTQ